MPFLQGNVALVVGLGLLALAITARFLTRDGQLKGDLRGAALFFFAFIVLRLAGYGIDALDVPAFSKANHVGWMLAFAFGSVRTAVAFGLAFYRRLSVGPSSKILRDVVDFALYGIATIPILKTQLQIDLTSLLATSAILSVVLGLALQETLGNLFAGLTLQLERPFASGDHISVGDHVGRVVQIAWRATRIETVRREEVTLPNSLIAKQPLRNFSRGGSPVAVDLFVGVAYHVPPNVVRAEVLAALGEIPLVLKDPPPMCRVTAFEDSSVKYLMRYFIADFATASAAHDEVHTRLWYRFSRAGIEIPFPQRVVHTRAATTDGPVAHAGLLSQIDLLAPFSDAERNELGAAATVRQFGRGETVIKEGAEGETFYVIAGGEVMVARGGVEVARLGRGAYLGEMSLLTGEPRSATVIAATDVTLLELGREAFGRHFAQHPERAKQLSEALATRRSQLSAIANSASASSSPEAAGDILSRLKQIFRMRD